MNREERNKRKQKWMAHGYAIGKQLAESGIAIADLMSGVRNEGASEFDTHTAVIEQVETVLHECNLSQFSEKFLIFMLAEAELRNDPQRG